MKKTLWITLLIILVACVFATIACDAVVRFSAKGAIYDQVDIIPHNKVGLLLGTAPFTPTGQHNYYFDYRIDAASSLFHAGKVDYVLVSGDNHVKDYDEATCMRDSLMAHGVPENRIVLDYAGFRTLDSVVRAKEIFGQDSITIISQQFHNERALYLAKHNDIHAVAFNAKDVSIRSKWLKIHTRELLARVKLFIDLAIGKQPHFLGDKIEIK
ncbi:MAG: YdcF family protein [Muribaculaceae bacterium]|nr:YdcF family protein [Muribaculaceae bacterium]